jgi:hypothetical protein
MAWECSGCCGKSIAIQELTEGIPGPDQNDRPLLQGLKPGHFPALVGAAEAAPLQSHPHGKASFPKPRARGPAHMSS